MSLFYSFFAQVDWLASLVKRIAIKGTISPIFQPPIFMGVYIKFFRFMILLLLDHKLLLLPLLGESMLLKNTSITFTLLFIGHDCGIGIILVEFPKNNLIDHIIIMGLKKYPNRSHLVIFFLYCYIIIDSILVPHKRGTNIFVFFYNFFKYETAYFKSANN